MFSMWQQLDDPGNTQEEYNSGKWEQRKRLTFSSLSCGFWSYNPLGRKFLDKEKKSVFIECTNSKFYKARKVCSKVKKAFVSEDKIWWKTKHLDTFLEDIKKNPSRVHQWERACEYTSTRFVKRSYFKAWKWERNTLHIKVWDCTSFSPDRFWEGNTI